eukprot:TRINITY_DN1736_c0_g1_i1.p1 TRINITY_DN1736_c0_g1~~TRINITY_DN1736_c0_g1_i1.p1  ORF type:complete len:443 (+),score=76.32 TRINITY_DN1736_c0_g1_i1:55-1383(+)
MAHAAGTLAGVSSGIMELGLASTSASVSGCVSQNVSSASSSARMPSVRQLPRYMGLSRQVFSQGLQQHTVVAGSSSLPQMNECRVSRGSVSTAAQAVASPPTTSTDSLPALNDLPLLSYVNQATGYIEPPKEPGTQASVFAVLDKNKKVQYIGFSKDVRNSLRILFGRRPEMCYYFKVANLNVLDQQQMLAMRQQWMSEMGLAPPGNSDPSQRLLWEKPSDAGSISERGKYAAAVSKAKTFQNIFAERGLKEQMVYNPALLEQGLCDILPSEEQTAEALESASRLAAEAAAKRRSVVMQGPAGQEVQFDVYFEHKYPTNGGWMFDVQVKMDDKETKHRIICGRIYPEAVGMVEEDFVERVIAFLLVKKIPRQTEGLLSSQQFPINYFSVSEVAQWYDDFKEWFTGDLPDTYWRFNRLHTYGAFADPAPLVGPQTPLPSSWKV